MQRITSRFTGPGLALLASAGERQRSADMWPQETFDTVIKGLVLSLRLTFSTAKCWRA